MKKSIVYTSVLLLMLTGCSGAEASISKSSNEQSQKEQVSEVNVTENKESTPKPTVVPTPIPTPTPLPKCNGTTVTSGCQVDGIEYTTYIYHPAVAEKSHNETVVVGQEQIITGYCTLCVDGSYSPTCATGRGACSHHGGVAQKNAPVYSTQQQTQTTTVIDTPAQDEYYEKIAK